MTVFLFSVHIPVKVAECDAAAGGNGTVESIDIVIDAFIHIFDAVGDIDLPAERLCFVTACQLFQLGNQLVAFAQRKELTALHGVYKQLQLGKLELPGWR